MEAEAVIWLLVMFVWFVSGIAKQIRSAGKKGPGAGTAEVVPPPVPQSVPPQHPLAQGQQPARPALTPAQGAGTSLQDLFRQLGVELVEEQPVESEHRPTASERRLTESEHRATVSEHRGSQGEHHQAAGEVSVTPGEHRGTASEHQLTASEHSRGDATSVVASSAMKPYSDHFRRRKGRLGREVRRQLHGDRRAFARAWLMKELLGPPPGLGPPDPGSR